jgi:hypothetical protein
MKLKNLLKKVLHLPATDLASEKNNTSSIKLTLKDYLKNRQFVESINLIDSIPFLPPYLTFTRHCLKILAFRDANALNALKQIDFFDLINKEYFSKRNEIEIALNRFLEQGNPDMILHLIYRLFSLYGTEKTLYEFKEENVEILTSLEKNGFAYIEGKMKQDLFEIAIKAIYSELETFCKDKKKGYFPANFINKKGYLGIQYNPEAQIHMDEISSINLELLQNAFYQSGLSNVLNNFYLSPFTVCNVRAWRYLYAEEGDSGFVGPHFDMLPVNTLKIMIYKGEIGLQDGCLELLDEDNKVFHKTLGKDVMILIDTNNIKHTAGIPRKHDRDTLEISIMSSVNLEPDFISAGFQAAYPVNPFASWNENPRILVAI